MSTQVLKMHGGFFFNLEFILLPRAITLKIINWIRKARTTALNLVNVVIVHRLYEIFTSSFVLKCKFLPTLPL